MLAAKATHCNSVVSVRACNCCQSEDSRELGLGVLTQLISISMSDKRRGEGHDLCISLRHRACATGPCDKIVRKTGLAIAQGMLLD